MDNTEALLRAILSTIARSSFSEERVLEIIGPKNSNSKQLAAFNLCDGNTSQSEIGKKTKIDKGNLSRTLNRWIDEGIVFRIGKEELPLHVFKVTLTPKEDKPK